VGGIQGDARVVAPAEGDDVNARAGVIPFYGKCGDCGRSLAGENLLLNGLEPCCRYCWESDDAETDHTLRDPQLVASEQVTDAKIAMDRPLSEYVHLPFGPVNELVGAIPPGDVGFVAAFSGLGKTTFVTSAIRGLIAQGKKLYCLPLESVPHAFRTHLACKTLGYHAGMVLTGEYKRSVPDQWPEIRKAIVEEMERQQTGEMSEQLYVSPVRTIDERAVSKAAKHAAKLGADVLIVDHVDHGEGADPLGESIRVADRILRTTQDEGFATLATTQVNNEGVKHDPLGQYMLPQPHHVWMGGKKRQVAAWMLGLGRALKLEGVSRDQLAAVRARRLEAWKVLEPNCMVVGAMKLRNFGEREGHKTWLRVENGCCVEDENLVAFAKHGIGTRSRA
jgi:KaiC/GvpD/RAD55 family RecA-like ATPase